ncbi:MAG TPA: hypothetical protein VFD43_03840, partial [Planctomycetota bacterium]|nr:hypothetical protein [Planctomycetota bacterium]
LLTAEWSADELDQAVEAAREVVRAVRAGQFAELGDYPERDDEPVWSWIAGRGLLAAAEAGNEADGEANGAGAGA